MSRRIQFGLFEFDSESGDLTREGRPVRLQPQPARVLEILTARAGQVVSREELRQLVWSDGTSVDFERGLNFCIAQIRAALKDSAESPRFIETLPRRGYRFIAPVRIAGADVSPTLPPEGQPPPARKWHPRSLAMGGLALGGLALAVVLVAAGLGDDRVRVAVVPFDNETGESAYSGLAQGIADATVARLASQERVEHLAVVGNSAALRRPRGFRDLKAIGEEAGVEFVVLAQVKRDDKGVRLIAHLIRVKDEAHVWAETFDRAEFTLQAQAEIAEAIAAAVSQRLATGP